MASVAARRAAPSRRSSLSFNEAEAFVASVVLDVSSAVEAEYDASMRPRLLWPRWTGRNTAIFDLP